MTLRGWHRTGTPVATPRQERLLGLTPEGSIRVSLRAFRAPDRSPTSGRRPSSGTGSTITSRS